MTIRLRFEKLPVDMMKLKCCKNPHFVAAQNFSVW